MTDIFILLLLSVLLIVVVSLFTLALSNLLVPRYKTSASRVPDDALAHFSNQTAKEPSTVDRGHISDADLDAIDLPPHLGGWTPAERFDQMEKEPIVAQYLISYAQRVYLNQLFQLRVVISSQETPLSPSPGQREAARGPLHFIHRWIQKQDEESDPRPDIRVQLKYDEEEFRVTNPVKVKSLPPAGELLYDFAVKSLKSEDSALTVEIAYVGSKWQPEQVTMIELTEENGRKSTTTKISPAGIVEDITVLAREELTIETKNFLNMNAASLNIFNKAAAIVLTSIYIVLVTSLELTDDITTTVIMGINIVVSTLGIPVGVNLWTDLQVKQEKASAGLLV